MSLHTSKKPSLGNVIKSLSIIPLNTEKSYFSSTIDISSITPNIYVCSYPVTKYPGLLYRNGLEDLIQFLNFKSGSNCWKIYNFKVESNYCDYTDQELLEIYKKNRTVDCFPLQQLNGQLANLMLEDGTLSLNDKNSLDKIVFRNGWLDHSPPPFLLLQTIVNDMHVHLSQNPENVILVHCKMGKGRSGTAIIAYLMKYMSCPLSESKTIFMSGRFKRNVSKGVTIYSQLRYLRYHEMLLNYHMSEEIMILHEIAKSAFKLKSIRINKPLGIFFSHHCSLSIKFQKYNNKRDGLELLQQLETSSLLNDSKSQNELTIPFYSSIAISDIRLEFGIRTNKHPIRDLLSSFVSYSYCWLNLYWETLRSNGLLNTNIYRFKEIIGDKNVEQELFTTTLNWEELDGTIGSPSKGIKMFDSFALTWSVCI